MAYPLPVQLEAIQQPLAFDVGAEAELVFDLTGVDPLPAADDVITVDFYTTGQVTNTLGLMGTSTTESRPTTVNEDGIGTPVVICGVVTNFFGPPTTVTTIGFFPTRSLEYGVQSLFEWLDVASFYWWKSPYPLSEDGFGGAETPPATFFPDADGPRTIVDFFSGALRGTGCDPVIVLPAASALQVAGVAPTVVATDNVFVAPVAAELQFAGVAPSLVVTQNRTVSPAAAELELQGPAPRVATPVGLSPAPAALEITSVAPVVTNSSGSPLFPEMSLYRMELFTNYGSSIADVSEIWLGTDASTRFTGTVTPSSSDADDQSKLVDDLLNTAESISSGSGAGTAYWQLSYADAQLLNYAKFARPSTTTTRRPRTWTLRGYSSALDQWLASKVVTNTDVFSSANVYRGDTDLTDAEIPIEFLLCEAGTLGGSAVTNAFTSTVPATRTGHVQANDAVLLAYGVVDGTTPVPSLVPDFSMTEAVNEDGLLLGVRTTLASGSEPTIYNLGIGVGTVASAVAVAELMFNVDAADPIASSATATSTLTPPSVTLTDARQVVVVVALMTSFTAVAVPTGFTNINSSGRSAGAGNMYLSLGFIKPGATGSYSPPAFSSAGTPERVATMVINPVLV